MEQINKIKDFRRLGNIKSEQLAGVIGWGSSRLRNYENGHRQPNLPDCRRIVHGLNRLGVLCTLDTVFPPATQCANDNSIKQDDVA